MFDLPIFIDTERAAIFTQRFVGYFERIFSVVKNAIKPYEQLATSWAEYRENHIEWFPFKQ